VAMNPQTGEVLAMVSLPSYDDNEFTGGIRRKTQGAANRLKSPLLNQAISGQFAPGSTFKIITASAGLAEGVIDDDTTFTAGVPCGYLTATIPKIPAWLSHSTAGRTNTVRATVPSA